MDELVGVGIYTPAEAQRLLAIPARKICRWLLGHSIKDREYQPLWRSQIDLNDGHLYLGFRDLMEVRIAYAFIRSGVSPQKIRAAIQVASALVGDQRPLSTDRFRTDGRDIFLRILELDEQGEQKERLLNLFRSQYEFKQVIEPLLKTIDFDQAGAPFKWWPQGRGARILIDPTRSFGQPIEAESAVPTSILAAAGRTEGITRAAQAFDVSSNAIRRAINFEAGLEKQAAA